MSRIESITGSTDVIDKTPMMMNEMKMVESMLRTKILVIFGEHKGTIIILLGDENQVNVILVLH